MHLSRLYHIAIVTRADFEPAVAMFHDHRYIDTLRKRTCAHFITSVTHHIKTKVIFLVCLHNYINSINSTAADLIFIRVPYSHRHYVFVRAIYPFWQFAFITCTYIWVRHAILVTCQLQLVNNTTLLLFKI